MNILLLETTSPKGSFGLYSFTADKLQAIKTKTWESPYHSSFITSVFESLLPKISIHDRHKKTILALGVGPGRFTGVRVGVSFAKTLNFVCKIPLYPVCSLKILAESQVKQKKPILVLVNGFKNTMYMALYQNQEDELKELIAPCLIQANDLCKTLNEKNLGSDYILKKTKKYICVGDGYKAYF